MRGLDVYEARIPHTLRGRDTVLEDLDRCDTDNLVAVLADLEPVVPGGEPSNDASFVVGFATLSKATPEQPSMMILEGLDEGPNLGPSCFDLGGFVDEADRFQDAYRPS